MSNDENLNACYEQFESLFGNLNTHVANAKYSGGYNEYSDLHVRLGVIGYEMNAPRKGWSDEHSDTITNLIKDCKNDQTNEEYLPFFSIAMGFLLGLYAVHKIEEDDFRRSYILLTGFVMTKQKGIDVQKNEPKKEDHKKKPGLFWFFKKKKSVAPKEPVKEKDGNKITYRYKEDPFGNTNKGYSQEPAGDYADTRMLKYAETFGECEGEFKDKEPLVPHVRVLCFPPNHNKRDYYTLVTSGMSDIPMSLPDEDKINSNRTELVFYCREPKNIYCELLRRVAHFPHDNSSYLGIGHTLPISSSGIFKSNPQLTTLLFMPSFVEEDMKLKETLKIKDSPVNLLWVVPISDAECNLKLKAGISGILDVFDKNEHSFVFDENRKGYV